MALGTTALTRTLDNLVLLAAKFSGIGFAVSKWARATNVVTLTTSAAHSFAANDYIVVRGVDATVDGEYSVLSVGTTTILFTCAGAAQPETTLVTTGGVSSRIGLGYRRFASAENFESIVTALTPSAQGWFDVELDAMAYSETDIVPVDILGALYVYIPKDVSNNLNAAWDFAYNFAAAIGAKTSYPSGTIAPSLVKFKKNSLDVVKTGGILTFDFGKFGEGAITVPDP